MARNAEGSAGMKRKGSNKFSTKKSKSDNNDKLDDVVATNATAKMQIDIDKGVEPMVRKRPKRVAACLNFKEQSVRLSKSSSVIEVKKNLTVEDEMEAVHLTKLGPEDLPPCRKLLDFVMHDDDGNPQPFEMSQYNDIFLSALIMPLDDNLEKVKDRGVKCDGFGRIENWAISGYDEGIPVIWVSTAFADYECVKPASNYRRFYDRFYEKARICVEVYRKLVRSAGGNPNLSLDELLAGVIRSMNGTKSFSSGVISRDFVISLGEFIYIQLIGLDQTLGNTDVSLATLPSLVALRDECRSRSESCMFPTGAINGSLKINEAEDLEVDEDDDMKLARLLQEEEDWTLMKQQRARRPASSQKNIYIKISEAEIANDYPLPAYYKPFVEEMDEYIFFEDETTMSYFDLPRRVLNNWALYNSDSRLISLELLPMKPCAEIDVMVFGSGNMREDDGSGFCLENALGQSSGSSHSMDADGVPIYLSAIKEWMIEFGASMIFVSIRTDVAWYRLGEPTKQYAPWYEPVLKTARLAISIITMLKEQSRVSRLSFSDVIKKVSEFEKDHPAQISSNLSLVERYVVVHGQIILQQFAEYPDATIRKCPFISGLTEKMEQRHHTKLVMKKKVALLKEANLNPSASMGPLSKRKVMRATTTKLINRIWRDYYSNYFPEDSRNEGQELKEEIEEEQDENEEDEAEEENTSLQMDKISKSHSPKRSCKSKTKRNETKWEGETTGKTDSGESLYRSAVVHGEVITVGMAIMIEDDESEEAPAIYFVEFMFEKHDGTRVVHGRFMQRGSQSVLGNAAKERELFLTNDCMEFELDDVKEPVALEIRRLPWGHKSRKEYADADAIDRAKAEERIKKGLPMEYYCKSLYCPEKGAFFTAPFDHLGLGTGACNSCKQTEIKEDEFKLSSKTSLIYRKIEYSVYDFVYASPQFFDEGGDDDHGTFKAGRNVGLKAYVVCQLLEIVTPSGSKQPTPKSTKVKVRRFYRPEDVSESKAYCSDIREVYHSEDTLNVPVEILEGKCEVRKKMELPDVELPVVVDHIFFCEYTYDAVNGAIKQLPANVKLWSQSKKLATTASRRNKGKGKCIEGEEDHNQWKDVPPESRLATLDIFAGCGGLSEGLQQSGATFTKWAIEYEQPAGEAFSQNHPETLMFIENCNVILRAIMEKCGDVDDCVATAEAAELAAGLDKEKVNNLPVPGKVDFINGGPPCQGFSGMNRFNQSSWSKVQCEMILAFLSFAEYFRPRYFLLENVRNFVSFNKGQTFRLTLASLLEMGYQVRFGILEAGAYGVSQSRKRAFIWAASPEEILPEWPEPMHVFAGPELKISLDKDSHYSAVQSTASGAPFRPITVRDTIGDLPPVENGAAKPTIDYGGDPVSWFQKQIRGSMLTLNDHISKEMNELNLIRCQRIPKRPGADWRDLPDEKVKLSSGQTVDLIPWCLPNTAKRHNQWKGLFGRLEWEGNFPTSITDPQPMGKVGMCFHPEQDRILTVRECARSQGFRDSYQFCGNIQNKHRQIGNAVPPPLAYALGRKLKEAIDAKHPSS